MLLKPFKNESGFILVLAMAMLVVLSIIGVAGTRTSVIDLKISGNERQMANEFNIADSLWQLGALWVNYKDQVPEIVNRTLLPADQATPEVFDTSEIYKIVRNYGMGPAATLNNNFPSGTQDGTVSNRNFWFKITRGDGERIRGGSKDYKRFPVDVEIDVEQRNHLKVRLNKDWKVEDY